MRLKVDFWWVWMPKWWFYQTSFEDQTINCKQMPKVQKHAKSIVFRWFWGFDAFDVERKRYEKLKLKPDMHVWWMFDRFWIDFQMISGSLLAEISIRKSLGMNFGIILSLFWDHGGPLERWWRAWCWKIALRTREPGGALPFWVQKLVCEPPESFPKPPLRHPKSNKSCEKKRSSTIW